MSGLYFKYGTMNSSKSANMLMIRHNYTSQGFEVALLKPAADTREGAAIVKSRIGLEAECILVPASASIYDIRTPEGKPLPEVPVIMVDECQFLTREQVDELYRISEKQVVMCFGLLTDFRRELFPGSMRLLELSDSIQEIKSICKCGKRAVANARFIDGVLQTQGEQVVIGAEESYRAMCRNCYDKEVIASFNLSK